MSSGRDSTLTPLFENTLAGLCGRHRYTKSEPPKHAVKVASRHASTSDHHRISGLVYLSSSTFSSSPSPSPSPPPPVYRFTGGRPSPPLSPPPNASGGTAKPLNQLLLLPDEESARDNGFAERGAAFRSPLRGTIPFTTDKDS
eukprot:1192582-Prorocentrum_minimum.AAC.2